MTLSRRGPSVRGLESTGSPVAAARFDRRRRKRRRRRARRVLALAVIVMLTPIVYSYVTTMLRPSSLPLWPRTVEWLRANHGNWLVDEVEHYYYTWKAPKKGGPQLTELPSVGVAPPSPGRATSTRAAAPRRLSAVWPWRVQAVFAHPLPGEGEWRGTGPIVRSRPPVLLTTFRTET